MLSFLRHIKLRSKIIVACLMIAGLSLLSIAVVLYETGKIGTKADTAGSNFVDIDTVVQSRATTTSACNKNDSTCSYQVAPGDLRATTLVNTLNSTHLSDAADEVEICIEKAMQNKLPTDVFGLLYTSSGLSGGKCTVQIEKLSDNEIFMTSGYKKDQNVSSNFPLVYKSPSSGSDFQGDAKILEGSLSYDFGNITSKRKYENGKWSAITTDISKTTAQGGINASYEIKLNDNQNLLSAMSKQNSDFIFDPKSTWRFTTNGTLKGSLDLLFSSNLKEGVKYNVRSASFCPQSCEITLTENLDLKAQKKGSQDKISGTIISKANHSETYTGRGAVDPITNRIYWQDLTVKKNDNRSWSQNLTYNSNIKVSYNGTTLATSLLQPLKNLSQITNHIDKSSKVSSSFTSMKKTLTQVYEAKMNQDETSENGKLTMRQGTGSYTATNASSYSGLYDSINSKLLVNVSSDKNYLKTRRDPFSETMVSQYAPTYFQQGSIYVPGFFTALSSTATTTTLSTPATKDLPANFIFMESFSKDDSVWSQADKDTIAKLKTDLKAHGVNVVTYKTQNKKDMLSAYGKIPSGSWVLNAGHGQPDGLKAGNEFVSYLEIMQVLKDKQIKIDVFAADSCYGGRAPLSQTVIGSLGPLYTNPTGQLLQSPGSLFMNWNLASNDIVAALNSIAKKNAQASAQNPVQNPWPFRR